MAVESYILTQDYKAPWVQITGMPHKPQAVKFKMLRKGEIVKGEMKHANNQPAFVLVAGTLVVPLQVIKKVVTQEVTSNASGEDKKDKIDKKEIVKMSSNPKVQYLDAIILGALAGFGGVYLAEKQGWLPPAVDKKNKIYGAIGGALLATYMVYRYKTNKASKVKEKQE